MNEIIRNMMLIITIGIITAGCATPSTILISPTGAPYRCATHGWGWAGVPMANAIHDSCVKDMKKIGYIEMPEVVWGVNLDFTKSPLRVVTVTNGSPADITGVKSGDIILAVDDKPLSNAGQLFVVLGSKEPGDVLRARIERDGKIVQVSSVLRSR